MEKKCCAWKSYFAGRARTTSLAGLVTGLLATAAAAGPLPAYRLDAALEPDGHRLAVTATVELPDALAGRPVEFLLSSQLAIAAAAPAAVRVPDEAGSPFMGINGTSAELASRAGVSRYRVELPPGGKAFTLTYAGAIDIPPTTSPEEYARSFQETPGYLGTEGIYLAGSTLWYPYLGDSLLSFELSAGAPEGWHLISQGNGTSRDAGGRAQWESGGPVDEIYLVGGPLLDYARPAGAVQAQVYLREQDDALAGRYLEATARYLELYRGLIGPYPYGKFALVENFWETGYGMPSFTLLGPQIIRFPFILTSSYPHEILHNWWGNSVFVDYPSGNWAEGLTAYLADHLMKEIDGLGAEYRRDTLKKYRDFVKESRDFPLSEFRSRHSAATEAVGYGKTLMGFHMLRLKLGDETFRRALAQFYASFRGRRASFADVQSIFEEVAQQGLGRFFDEWVTRTGAPDLSVADVAVAPRGGQFVITGTLEQRQPGPYALSVPVVVETETGRVAASIATRERRTRFSIASASQPRALAVDPEFDLFRLLDPRETAPSIGQIFGEPRILAVLPTGNQAETQAYRDMVTAWQSPAQEIEIVLDRELDALPEDTAAWVLGRGNRLADRLFANQPALGFETNSEVAKLEGQSLAWSGHSLVTVLRHPANPAKAIGWITADPPEAIPGLARKLPHYGKYSYLGFEGPEPANTTKGEWPAADSPLLVSLAAGAPPRVEAPPRRAPLAELPPVFDRDRLLAHVSYLAAAEREGRGVGSAGLEEAARYIAEQFAAAGLLPAGDANSWFQEFESPTGPDGKPHTVRNVVGYVPGSDPALEGQAGIVSAHYDHLGLGWPDVRAEAVGQIHHGADDNASGVAVLIELARALAQGPPPRRSLVLVAFSAEESGLLGSRHYVANPVPVPQPGIVGVVNLDTVGRLGDGPVQVLGAESAREWPFVFQGIGFVTGVPVKVVSGASQSSDQQSFIDAGIPGVQIFTGAHLDYHRPSDTADKVDGDGLVRVAMVAREAASYLGDTPKPPAFAATGRTEPATAVLTQQTAEGNRRRVSFGTVPDFSFQGPGIRVESVVPDSPAERAGLRAGDIVTRLDDKEVASLGSFSELLKQYAPGDRVRATWLRDGEPLEAELELVAR